MTIRFSVKAVAAATMTAVFYVAGCAVETPRAPVRSIDHACLPAGAPNRHIKAFKGDIPAQCIEIANVDSFIACNMNEAAANKMLTDIRAKGATLGADALVRVALLHNRRQGFVDQPRTPFRSWTQGETREYFMRGVAVRFERVEKLPREAVAADFAPKAGAGGEGEGKQGGSVLFGGMGGLAGGSLAPPMPKIPRVGSPQP
ncbi:MAG: hypothetical protein WCK47_13655 [bacterium]